MLKRVSLPRDQLTQLLRMCGENPKAHNNSTLRMVIHAAEVCVVADDLRITELEGDVAYLRQLRKDWHDTPWWRMVGYAVTGRRER